MITQQELQADRDFAEKLDFKGVKFPVKIRGIHKIEKRLPSALVFLALKIKKNNDSVYKKKTKKRWFIINTRRKETFCYYQRF